jgi:hypothetical protein
MSVYDTASSRGDGRGDGIRDDLRDLESGDFPAAIYERTAGARHQSLRPVTRGKLPDQKLGLPFTPTKPGRQVDVADAALVCGWGSRWHKGYRPENALGIVVDQARRRARPVPRMEVLF